MSAFKVAGLLYVLLSIAGVLGTLVIPNSVIVSQNAAQTAERLRQSESIFRLGLAIELIAAVVFLFVAWALYRLFKTVDHDGALLMAMLVMVSVPISFLAVVSRLSALVVLSGDGYLSAFEPAQLESLAYVFLRLHGQTYQVVQLFHGLWLFPLAALAMRSGRVPLVVSALVLIAGAAYVTLSLTNVLAPQSVAAVSTITMPLVAGEIAIIFWLLTTRARAPLVAGT